MTDLKEEIRDYLLATFPMARKKKITFEESLLETGILDSLGVLEFVGYLSERLNIEIEDEDLTQENFQNIRSIVHLVKRKKANA